MKKFYVDINNKKIGITEWGNSKKETIICLHGLGGSSLSFIEVGDMLADKYHLISIDLPGHGRTEELVTIQDYKMENLADWVDAVIVELGYTDFYLLAHSWGGFIALYYSVKHKNKVKKVLLIDGGYQQKDKMNEFMGTTIEEEVSSYEKDFDEYIFNTEEEFYSFEETMYLRYSEQLKIASRDLMKAEAGKLRFIASGAVAKKAILGMYYSPVDKIFNKLQGNILLLESTLPETWLAARDYMATYIVKNTKVKLKKIEGVTHMMHWDNPQIVVDEIKDFFRL